ncbi:MAG TPA: TIM44-like domain-containing protein [Spirochaetia bacterium]|nr:TIM44-like domain-containing protein [Spirochaetia bacterium]
MSKRQIALIVILILVTVLFLAAMPAWARGGGGLGGESFGGGGESFGGGGSFGGGSFGGGGMGGFGFFPIFLGGGFGSSGTFIFIIIVILLLNWLRNSGFRTGGGRRRSSGRQGGGGHPQQRVLPMEPTNLAYEQAFAKAIDYARQNMEYYGTRFPYWESGMLVGRVKQAFFILQDSWSRLDLSGSRDYLTADLYSLYEEKLSQMRERGERDIIRDINLRDQDISFIYSRMDEERQSFIAMIFASMYDYVTNPAGEVISGNRDKKLYFREFWEFVWQDEAWKLVRIHEEDSVTIGRIKNMDLEV